MEIWVHSDPGSRARLAREERRQDRSPSFLKERQKDRKKDICLSSLPAGKKDRKKPFQKPCCLESMKE
jgi:hypothetical protein